MPIARQRKPRESQTATRERALDLACAAVAENRTAVGLVAPSIEDVVAMSVQAGNRLSRSALYRIWPYKGDMVPAVLGRLIEADIYSTNSVTERSNKATTAIVGQAARGELPEGLASARPMVVRAIGNALLTGTNHAVAARIESVIGMMPDAPELQEMLADSRATYVGAVANGYRQAHELLGDTVRNNCDDTDDVYPQYAQSAITLVRGVALTPFVNGPNDEPPDLQEIHYRQLDLIADHYTLPRS